jgi:GMP synthase (glutamine-hydrolysing)
VLCTPAPAFNDVPLGAVLQWHQDSYALPIGASPLGTSPMCANQGYVLTRGRQALFGVQFHPEWDAVTLAQLIAQFAPELTDANTRVLRAALTATQHFAAQPQLAAQLLNSWCARW